VGALGRGLLGEERGDRLVGGDAGLGGSEGGVGPGLQLAVFSATSLGVEASGQVSLFGDRLTLDANTTYQAFRNTSDEGVFALFEGDRIPNRPFFFANAAASYQAGSPIRRGDAVSLFAGTRYVQSFFRTWESVGIQEFKIEVPTQTTVNLGATYESATQGLRWALTGEVQNVTDATVFDFFGVQRPGRAVYLKLTTQL
ncbi:MAG: ligand-gated channel protein, partial [Bacteroidota bacterium]